MTRARGDFLTGASRRIEEARQAKIDEACGYRRDCIEQMRADGQTVTAAASAATAPAPKKPGLDAAAGMMGGMGGS